LPDGVKTAKCRCSKLALFSWSWYCPFRLCHSQVPPKILYAWLIC
jgi:hypothetical protein